MIYYFLVLLLFSFCLCEQYANPREKIFVNYSYIVLAAILIIFTAGRYEVGYDWVAYYDFFTKRDDISGFEPGYIFYNNLFPTYYTMQIITCIIGCVVLFKYIYNNSFYPILVLFFCVFSGYSYMTLTFDTFRQFIAETIIILGMPFVKKRKLIPWVLIIAFAMQFHVSAIFAFFIYFLNFRFSKKTYYIIFFGCVFIYFCGSSLINGILQIAVGLGFLPARLRNLISIYMSFPSANAASLLTQVLGFSIKAFLILYIIHYSDFIKNNYYLNSYLVFFLLYTLGHNFAAFKRFETYYLYCGGGIFCYEVFSLRRVIQSKTKMNYKIIDFAAVLLVMAYTFINWLRGNPSFMNYRNILEVY